MNQSDFMPIVFTPSMGSNSTSNDTGNSTSITSNDTIWNHTASLMPISNHTISISDQLADLLDRYRYIIMVLITIVILACVYKVKSRR